MANTSTTNQDQNSCTTVDLDCDHMWSLAQQFAYSRLAQKKGNGKIALIDSYYARAQRIAATYARFYLETEIGGNPKLKGRYYWMALGAFASKTVACSLADPRVLAIPIVNINLAKGNFWLFMDIAPWHWYWSNHKNSFSKCQKERGADQCVTQVKAVLIDLPWAKESLPKIQNFKSNDNIKKGMEKVKEFEDKPQTLRPKIQLDNLLAIAKHEQGNVLQPLIYDNSDFSKWIERQRWPVVKQISPTLQLVFSHSCDINDSRLKSIAPDDTVLENFQSRMDWITSIANQFHDLMQGKEQDVDITYMENELKQIAGWVGNSRSI